MDDGQADWPRRIHSTPQSWDPPLEREQTGHRKIAPVEKILKSFVQRAVTEVRRISAVDSDAIRLGVFAQHCVTGLMGFGNVRCFSHIPPNAKEDAKYQLVYSGRSESL